MRTTIPTNVYIFRDLLYNHGETGMRITCAVIYCLLAYFRVIESPIAKTSNRHRPEDLCYLVDSHFLSGPISPTPCPSSLNWVECVVLLWTTVWYCIVIAKKSCNYQLRCLGKCWHWSDKTNQQLDYIEMKFPSIFIFDWKISMKFILQHNGVVFMRSMTPLGFYCVGHDLFWVWYIIITAGGAMAGGSATSSVALVLTAKTMFFLLIHEHDSLLVEMNYIQYNYVQHIKWKQLRVNDFYIITWSIHAVFGQLHKSSVPMNKFYIMHWFM